MRRICLIPGTFDPMTLGHTDIIDRALALFDEITIGIGVNTQKRPMFPLEKRIAWCREVYHDEPRIRVVSYEGLTVDLCHEIGARYLLRGIRFTADLEYERAIADVNRQLAPDIETVFLTPSLAWSTLASTLVREVIRYGGDVSAFIPAPIAEDVARTAAASRNAGSQT